MNELWVAMNELWAMTSTPAYLNIGGLVLDIIGVIMLFIARRACPWP